MLSLELLRRATQRLKPRVREHFKGLIKSPETNTTYVLEDLSPVWVEDVFTCLCRVGEEKSQPMVAFGCRKRKAG
jgi:hypothetical protein